MTWKDFLNSAGSLPDFGGEIFLFPPFIFIVALCSLVKTCCNCLFIAENKIVFYNLVLFSFSPYECYGNLHIEQDNSIQNLVTLSL